MSAARTLAMAVAGLAVLVCGVSRATVGTVTEPPGTTALDHAAARGETMPRLHSLLMSRHGELVMERYFHGHGPGDLANVKSVSKSILSALVGIAIDRGAVAGIDVTLADFFSGELAGQPGDPKGSITLDDLLTMRTGLRSTSNANYGAWVLSDNWVEAALQQPLESIPGAEMRYSTGNTHLISALLTRATGLDTHEFAQQVLAGPMGFTLSPWPRDPQGIYFGGNDMRLTPRQMLAFGELYLNGGRMGDRQIVPAAWVEESIRPHATSPHGVSRYYGYGWWVCELAGHAAPHAWGYGGQFIVIVPDLDLVIATTSSPGAGPAANTHANEVYRLVQEMIRSVDDTPPDLAPRAVAGSQSAGAY